MCVFLSFKTVYTANICLHVAFFLSSSPLHHFKAWNALAPNYNKIWFCVDLQGGLGATCSAKEPGVDHWPGQEVILYYPLARIHVDHLNPSLWPSKHLPGFGFHVNLYSGSLARCYLGVKIPIAPTLWFHFCTFFFWCVWLLLYDGSNIFFPKLTHSR